MKRRFFDFTKTLDVLNQNALMAEETSSPICQDTGMACVLWK